MSKKNPDLVVCFDLDDTLTHTSYKYNLASHRCAALIVEALGPYAPYGRHLFTEFEELDISLISIMQYSQHRYPMSWVIFYRELCLRHDVPIDPEVVRSLATEAKKFAEPPFKLVPGAKEVLEELCGRASDGVYILPERLRQKSPLEQLSIELHLMTIGEEKLQQLKIDDTGIRQYFKTVSVANKDKTHLLTNLRNRLLEGTPIALVGDSLRHDVLAANKAGVISVQIPSPDRCAWRYQDDVEGARPDFVLRSLKELPGLIPQLLTSEKED